MHTKQSDEQLANERGDNAREAFLTLYDRYITPIYRFVYFRVPSKEIAEDIVSDIFLKAWERRTQFQFEQGGTYKSWLYTIARHTIIDWQRTKKDAVDLSQIAHLSTLDSHGDPHLSDILMKALQTLSEDQQDVIRLRFWHELSYKEIATILEKSPTSCRMQASRAMQTLRDTLPPEVFLAIIFFLHTL